MTTERPGDYCWLCGIVRDEHAAGDHDLVPFPPEAFEESATLPHFPESSLRIWAVVGSSEGAAPGPPWTHVISPAPERTEEIAPGHRIVINCDETLYVARIECDWGTDPDRPCLAVDCPQCQATASAECLAGIGGCEGATAIEGCGVVDWSTAAGMEGIVIEDLNVSIPAAVAWNGDGWTLTCEEANAACDGLSVAGGEADA